MIYIAADHPLPLIPWHKEKPDYHVVAVTEAEKAVRRHFSKPHVRYAGTEEGCGCPYNYGRTAPEYQTEAADLAVAQRSREKLVQYIRKNRVQELFSCWAGEEPESLRKFRQIAPEDILRDHFAFEEHELIKIETSDSDEEFKGTQ